MRTLRTLRLRGWLVTVGCTAIAVAAYWIIVLRSPARTNPQAVASAEDEVYEAVIRDFASPPKEDSKTEARISKLVFSEKLDTFLCPGVDKKTCADGVRRRFALAGGGTIRADTIEDFIARSQTEGLLSKTFHTDLPRDFVAPEAVYFDIEPINKHDEKQFNQLFAGASGIISFSHVGFDSGLREAIVSVSFVCGGLCGSGHRYVLRKKWGRWEVVDKWMVWVS